MGVLQKFKDINHIIFPPKKTLGIDIESSRIGYPTIPDPSTLPQDQIHIDAHNRPELDPTDNLSLFRHLTGIASHPSMSHTTSFFTSHGRPAPNIGIYARVLHNEQTAKVGYKYFSWLINGCLGLQIVVAASLTALGAAGGSRGAVTVFGAINTVFAGILTFLKGSGLPNRFKYYRTEWRRVREFIEQRERDFSRPDCELDVHAVVALVEAMYEEVKMDLEASQPDRFAGANSARKSVVLPEITQGYKFPSKRVETFFEKGKEVEDGIDNRVKSLGKEVEEGIDNRVKNFSKEVEEGIGTRVKNLASEISHFAHEAKEVGKDIQAQNDRIAAGANREVKEYADRMDHLEKAFGGKDKDLEK